MQAALLNTGYKKNTEAVNDHERFDYWRESICHEFVELDCDSIKRDGFSGELRGGAGISGVRFAEVISDAQEVKRTKQQLVRSDRDDFLISFQLSNTGIVRQRGREAILTPGSFALYDATEPYTLSFAERFHQLVVQMPKSVLACHLMNAEAYTATRMAGDEGLGAVLSNFLFALARELQNVPEDSKELGDNLVNMIAMAFSSSVMLEEIGSNTVARQALKRRVLAYVENNLCDQELSNKKIAESQGISLRYLHKLFEEDAESLHALVLHKRLERAHEALSDAQLRGHSIESIAYRFGFSSAGHFSRAFKKHYGVNPSALRS
jgi:AraC-like DNA-binding protein